MSKGNKMKNTIYDWFCYYICGLPDGMHISDYLAEQKERLGWVWWFFPITTLLFSLIMLGFQVWLAIHIVTFKIKGRIN